MGPVTPRQPLTPNPLSVETMKRHPIFSTPEEDTNSRTLTRVPDSDPDQTYVTMELQDNPSSLERDEEPCETYVEMGGLRPLPQHTYVNRPASPTAPPRSCSPSPSISSLTSPPALYQNIHLPQLDHETAQKLISNVKGLMGTVKEQAADILTLKKTVKDLKLKVEALERYNAQEFDYDH